MKKHLASTLALLSMIVTLHGAEFYVSPQGNDGDPGTLNKPFKTILRARNAARELKAQAKGEMPEGGITVWLRGGRYEMAEPLQLGPEDSGQQGRPMVYRSYTEEQPLLSGGRVIG